MPAIPDILGVHNTMPQLQGRSESPTPTTANTMAWVVAAIVGGVVSFGVTFALFLRWVTRQHRCREDKPINPYPYLAPEQILKRRQMSEMGMFWEEEERRQYMIRKSLATRSTDSTGSGFSAVMDHIDQELRDMERQEPASLKEDWKRWEARVQQERSVSGDRHPAVSAASGGVPILAVPKPTRHRSLSRMPLLRHASSASNRPPVPPRHPGRRQPS